MPSDYCDRTQLRNYLDLEATATGDDALLDDLIQLYGRYSDQLVALESVTRRFLNEDRSVTAFLYEQLLWVRSVPRPIIPRPAGLVAAFGWLNSGSEWGEGIYILVESAWRYPVRSLSVLALFGLVAWTPLIGWIVTGLIIGRGSNYLHDLVDRWLAPVVRD